MVGNSLRPDICDAAGVELLLPSVNGLVSLVIAEEGLGRWAEAHC